MKGKKNGRRKAKVSEAELKSPEAAQNSTKNSGAAKEEAMGRTEGPAHLTGVSPRQEEETGQLSSLSADNSIAEEEGVGGNRGPNPVVSGAKGRKEKGVILEVFVLLW